MPRNTTKLTNTPKIPFSPTRNTFFLKMYFLKRKFCEINYIKGLTTINIQEILSYGMLSAQTLKITSDSAQARIADPFQENIATQ